jgi:hypothetical protein
VERPSCKEQGIVMAFTGSKMNKGKLLAATAFALGLLTSSAYAYTPEQQQMCSGDAMRLCGEYIPDVDRITACMIRKYSQLSEGCGRCSTHRRRHRRQHRQRTPRRPRPSLESRSTSRRT